MYLNKHCPTVFNNLSLGVGTANYDLQGCNIMRFSVGLSIVFLLLTGCAQMENIGRKVEDAGRFVKYNVQGEHYLLSKNYEHGHEIFTEAVKHTPEDAQAHYFKGRFQLALDKNKDALKSLKKAVVFDSEDADYWFWLGVSHGENGHPKSEKKSYKKALSLKKDHLQALIYLGHNELKAKQYKTALQTYRKALKIWPQSPSSLYNRALLLKILKRTPEEKRAWLAYLDLYPAGSLARRATTHLNWLSDFSYRNHSLAARTVTLGKIRFDRFQDKLSKASYLSLDVIGATVSNMPKGTLHVIAYQKNNKPLARKKAISVKKYLKEHFEELGKKKRIQVSWFDVPETYFAGKKKVIANESIRFFLTDLK